MLRANFENIAEFCLRLRLNDRAWICFVVTTQFYMKYVKLQCLRHWKSANGQEPNGMCPPIAPACRLGVSSHESMSSHFHRAGGPGTVQILLNQGDRAEPREITAAVGSREGRGGRSGGLARTSDGKGCLLDSDGKGCEETTKARKELP